MNIIFVLVDSLNKEALSVYNPDTPCRTPNLAGFAAKSHVFDNYFISSLPCMPARREISAGRKDFLWRPWGPLEIFDPRLPREIQKQGYNTGLVTDHYHYWEETANGYMQGFMSLEMIRGHETDYHTLPPEGDVPAWVEKMSEFRSAYHMRQYYENVKGFETEADFFPAKTFTAAGEWLEKYAERGPFFLQVESFDVHEPFHVPAPYDTMYTGDLPGDAGDYNIWPPYQVYADQDAFFAQTSPEELAYLRAQYYGKTTMVDTWIGKLFDRLTALDLWKNTMVVFTTDHGHDLGERGGFGKQYPHYDSHANIPLMVWHPEHAGDGRRVDALVQNVDLFSTLIDASGGTPPEATRHSQSFLPVITEAAGARDAITYGTFGQGICLTDGEWTLFKSPVEGKPLYTYSTMITTPLIVDNPVDGRVGKAPTAPADQGPFDPSVPYPLWKTPITIDPRTCEDHLYHRASDPGQTQNLWHSHPDQRARMLALLVERMQAEGSPPEQFERLGLDVLPIAAE
ncbi:Choline-sulfatase [Candidatus Rhodobacter oscarellae]|uniref:Choline-sulfatase n=1 Tax=Candidatus Rhodobacter oscarellae TaxID=1675527 RepID=A0A0J9E7W6_9RHOB|nr:sulfatase [Candidatus Rhodobacter lobularis]KMW58835.1 Choline-sulfatase [Candidatus Rhodobacter lobularis]